MALAQRGNLQDYQPTVGEFPVNVISPRQLVSKIASAG